MIIRRVYKSEYEKDEIGTNETVIFWSIICIAFGVMLLLNILTPMIADDYNYSFHYIGGTRIQNLYDVFTSCMAHYNLWGGRILSHGVIYYLSMFPTIVFDLLNSLVFVLFGIVIYGLIYIRFEINPGAILLIYVTMFLCIPTFGQTALWFVGSVNYLWTLVLMTTFLVPYIWYIIKRKSILDAKWGICFGFVGFSAGFCNENTSAATILGAVFFVIYMIYKKIKVKAWMITGIIAAMVGWVIMIIAPGNKVRSNIVNPDGFSLMFLKDRFVNCISLIEGEMRWLLIAFIVLLILAIKYKVDQDKIAIAVVFFLVAMASNFAMLFNVAGYSTRSFIATEVYSAIGGLILLNELKDKFSDLTKAVLYVYVGYIFATTFIHGADAIFTTYFWHTQRAQYIEQEVANGNGNIETYYIKSMNPYSVFYGIEDLTENKDYWTNVSFSMYHHLESISTIEVKVK